LDRDKLLTSVEDNAPIIHSLRHKDTVTRPRDDCSGSSSVNGFPFGKVNKACRFWKHKNNALLQHWVTDAESMQCALVITADIARRGSSEKVPVNLQGMNEPHG